MQAHLTGPSSIHNTVNPFSSPKVLATFIIPQIEAYLAANNSRLLILHYPFNHLATIVALRKLIGQDIFKIAGVVDSLSSDPPPRIPANRLSNDVTSSKGNKGLPRAHSHDAAQRQNSIPSHISSLNIGTRQHKKSESTASFSKANYLLPSTAINAEITTFLSEISMSLTEKSPSTPLNQNQNQNRSPSSTRSSPRHQHQQPPLPSAILHILQSRTAAARDENPRSRA